MSPAIDDRTDPIGPNPVPVPASACIASGPPFLAPWRVINSPEPAGFWKAVRVNPWGGDWVMQLGADPHPSNAPYTTGQLIAGFQWCGYLPTGLHTFLVRFANGPITANASGGTISASLFLHVDGCGTSQVAQRNCVQYLQVVRFLYAGTHTLSFGGLIKSAYQCAASPYGEIIVGRSEFTHFPSGAYAAAGVQAAAAPEGLSESLSEDLGESLFDEEKLETVEISPRKEAQIRLDSLTVSV